MIIPSDAHLPELPQQRDTPIGCIGSGFIMADCHLVAYRQAGFNPVAIASRTPENAQRVATRHGLTAFVTYQEMLEQADIAVVDVAVPRTFNWKSYERSSNTLGRLKGFWHKNRWASIINRP